MTDYTITTDFGAKDSLPSGNAGKVIKGSEFTTEFTNIKTAVNSKADTAGDTFTGAVTFDAAVTLNADVTFDTNTMFVDVSANRVGIGTTSPASALDVTGTVTADGLTVEATSNALIRVSDTSNVNQRLDLQHNGNLSSIISGNNGTYGTLKIQGYNGTDTVDRFKIAAGGDISFYEDTGTTPKLFWDASAESLGIGTSSPDSKLHVQSGGEAIKVNTVNENTHISFGGARAKFGYARIGASDLACIQGSSGKGIVFCTDNDTFGSGEKARISNLGNLVVGTTSYQGSGGSGAKGVFIGQDGLFSATRSDATVAVFNRTTSNGAAVEFRKNGTQVGTITLTDSATSYNTSSDERLKENITDSADAGSKVDAIQIRQFDWKADGSHQDYGVIAQELVEVAPEAVHQPEDSEDMMGVDYSKLVPMLIKEVQSLRSRVAELESE